MRNADAVTAADPSRRRRSPALAMIALAVCAQAAFGCAERCRDDDPGRVAAFRAAWRGDVEAMRELIAENPALANARECPPEEGVMARLLARQMGAGTPSVLHVAARQGHVDLVEVLLAAGAEREARGRLVDAPLHLAAQYGHDEVVRVLLAAGASVDARRNGGMTALHVAAGHGRFPVVKRLLAAGADANAREAGGWTPLHRAASEGHPNIVRLLLDAGADPRAADDQGTTPFEYAALNRHHDVSELLTTPGFFSSGAGSGPAALLRAAANGDADGVRLLLARGVAVDARDRDGLTPLQRAINQHPGGDADWRAERMREEAAVVELLLAAGADVEASGRDGNRPLHTAARFGRVDLAELLLARGADVNARNDWGWAPLHFAASQHEADMVALLLKRGADPQARDTAGRTPLGEAFGDARLEALLKQEGAPR